MLRQTFRFALPVFLAAAQLLWAGRWHEVYNDQNSGIINAVAATDYDFNKMYAVGDDGRFWQTFDGGHWWEERGTPTSEHLHDVVTFFGETDDVVIAVGDNGTLLHSADGGHFWTPLSAPAAVDYFCVEFDFYNGLIWIGGENGALYYSDDEGQSWQSVTLGLAYDVVDLASSNDGLFVAGVMGDTSYVQHVLPFVQTPLPLLPGDTLADTRIEAITRLDSMIFIGANATDGSDVQILSRLFDGSSLGLPQLLAAPQSSDLTDLTGLNYWKSDGQGSVLVQRLWYATDEGQILESADGAISWQKVYEDPQKRSLYSIVANASSTLEQGQAVAAGEDFFTLRRSFELLHIHPYKNDQVHYPLSGLEVQFSAVPVLADVNSNIVVESSVRGRLAFDAVYDFDDSTRVFLDVPDQGFGRHIPGETWRVSVAPSIKELTPDPFPAGIEAFTYEVTFVPQNAGAMAFEISAVQELSAGSVSAATVGFFDDDDRPEIAAWHGDRLALYTFNKDGSVKDTYEQNFSFSLSVDNSIEQQLLSSDVNLDGRNDILLFDNNEAQLLINQSDGGYAFSEGMNFNSANIRQMAFLQADDDPRPDLLVLNDTLYLRMNIDAGNSGTHTVVVETQTDVTRFKIGDVDVNGWPDIVAITSDGDLRYYPHFGYGSFNMPTSHFQGVSYRDILLADLDRDHQLEVLALRDNDLDIYRTDFTNGPDLMLDPVSPVGPGAGTLIDAFAVQEFGGYRDDFSGEPFMDVMLFTEDRRLTVLENIGGHGALAFKEVSGDSLNLPYKAWRVTSADNDGDGFLDIFVHNMQNDSITLIVNSTYTPAITTLETNETGVRVGWQSFPADLGSFEFYRLYRDSTGPEMHNPEIIEFNAVDDTTFLDRGTRPFRAYWYAVEAIFDAGQVTERSLVRQIDLIRKLGGELSGTLSDTVNGMWVDSALVVPPGQTLRIEEGVRFSFAPGAFLQVDGSLVGRGSERKMVGFWRNHDDFGYWKGIIAGATADSVSLHWFSLEGAETAIASEGASVSLTLGGIEDNLSGLHLNNAALTMKNVNFDSNATAISLAGTSVANIKNINILRSLSSGLEAGTGTTVNLSNSILWANPVSVSSAAGSNVSVRYSTVDSINGPADVFSVSKLPPLFNDADTAYFQPLLMSPTIDAGDPADNYSMEPLPNGKRVNQGLYGGTFFATPTFQPKLTILQDSLSFSAPLGGADTLNLRLRNTGNVPLQLNSVTVADPAAFRVSAPGTTVGAGESSIIRIIFRASERAVYHDKLVINSSDPHAPVKTIDLRGDVTNRLPYFVTNPATQARVGQFYSQPLEARDDDGDELSITILQSPQWLGLNADALEGTPALGDTGTHAVSVQAQDVLGGTGRLDFDVHVTFINGAPQWSVSDTLLVNEDESAVFDLAEFVSDDDTAPDLLRFEVTAVSDSQNIKYALDKSALSISPAADYFSEETDWLRVSATDAGGLNSVGQLFLVVTPQNDAPRFTALRDTVLYTHLEYRRTWPVSEVDGDLLTFADNTSLFNINDAGQIAFTPTLQDTGAHEVVLSASDGFFTVSDTVIFSIMPNVVPAPETLFLSARDRAIDLSFRVHPSEFYSGTIVVISGEAAVNAPDQGLLTLDTVFAVADSAVNANVAIDDLGINRRYYVSVFNYYDENGVIYSRPIQGQIQTPAPRLVLPERSSRFVLPVNKTQTAAIKVKNDGGGTLQGKWIYTPDSLTQVWFHADTAGRAIAPGDSAEFEINLHPNKYMPRGNRQVTLAFVSNDPLQQGGATFSVVLEPIFDDFAPRVVWQSLPDSILRQSALVAHYALDDTSGRPIGDPPAALQSAWRLQKLDGDIVAATDSSSDLAARVYPLEDGVYRLTVWGFDSEGNGVDASSASHFAFRVQASAIVLPAKRWLLVGLPRPHEGTWQQFSDSTRRLYKWDNAEERYLTDSEFASSTAVDGQAVWMISERPVPVDMSGHRQPGAQDTLAVDIVTGWNQVAVPVSYSTFWKKMLFQPQGQQAVTLEQAGRDGLVTPAVYWYQYKDDRQGYDWAALDSAYSMPWRGFWLQSTTPGRLYFTTEAADLFEMRKANAIVGLAKGQSAQGWRLNLTLENDSYIDKGNVIGEGGSFMQQRIEEPPHFGSYCALSITSNGKNWTQDIREQSGDVHKWALRVSSQEASREHLIYWNHRVLEEQGVFLFLVDPRNGTAIEMNSESSYRFTPSRETVAFEIYASYDPAFEPVIVPETLRLEQNYPNPFNPATTIRFAVPGSDAQNVRLEVFNTLGQQVAVLTDKKYKPGYHDLQWKGVDHSGRPLPAGVYFYRLKAAGNQLVRKMVLLK